MKMSRISMPPAAGRSPGETPNNDAVARTPASTRKSADARAAKAVPTPQEIRKAVDDINDAMRSLASELRFSIDEKTSGIVVRVLDMRTNQLIREFSAGKVLGIAKAAKEVVRGVLLQESV